jgi:hypothetical protein
MYLSSRCLETNCLTPFFYCCVRVLLNNGCFCGSAVLAWSKYATVLSTHLRLGLPTDHFPSGSCIITAYPNFPRKEFVGWYDLETSGLLDSNPLYFRISLVAEQYGSSSFAVWTKEALDTLVYSTFNYMFCNSLCRLVAFWYKARNIFARSNIETLDSDPIRGTYICLRSYCMCVVTETVVIDLYWPVYVL